MSIAIERITPLMRWHGIRVGSRAISGRAYLRMSEWNSGWRVGVMGIHWPGTRLLWYTAP